MIKKFCEIIKQKERNNSRNFIMFVTKLYRLQHKYTIIIYFKYTISYHIIVEVFGIKIAYTYIVYTNISYTQKHTTTILCIYLYTIVKGSTVIYTHHCYATINTILIIRLIYYICIYVCMYICMYVYMYVCIICYWLYPN